MKLLLAIFIVLFIPFQQSFDEALDSLKTKVDTVEGREKVQVMNSIAEKYTSLAPKKGIDYGKSAVALAKKIGYTTGYADGMEIIGGIYYQLGDFENAIQYYLDALRIYREQGNSEGVANVYDQVGKCYRDMSNYEKALEYH